MQPLKICLLFVAIVIVVCCESYSQPLPVRLEESSLRDSGALEAIKAVMLKQDLDGVVAELKGRLSNQASVEGALIRCLNSKAQSREGANLQYVAAEYLGKFHSYRAVPALIDNITLRRDYVLLTEGFDLGEVQWFYPCVNALVDIDLSAGPLIIQHLARGKKKLDDFHIELAAYCLLKIRRDKSKVRTIIDDASRKDLLDTVQREIDKGEGNIERLNRLSDWIVKIDPFMYDDVEGPGGGRYVAPEGSEYFRLREERQPNR